jgi:hypothetical protein
MLRTAIFVVGIAIGYFYGFRDSKEYGKPITTRLLDRIDAKAQLYTASDSTAAAEASR